MESPFVPQSLAHAVTAFGQLSLGSLDDAGDARCVLKSGYETVVRGRREGS